MPPRPGRGPHLVGIAWYREADWPRLRALFTDADELPRSYAEWHASAERLVAELDRGGLTAERVPLDPDAFASWCAAQGLAPDAQARSRYAGEAVAAKLRPGH
jgi:hypothetical protein